MDTVGAIKVSIPPCSPECNPIVNIFNYVSDENCTEAFEKSVNYEILEQFPVRVKHILENAPTKPIYNTIESMPKRMPMVIK